MLENEVAQMGGQGDRNRQVHCAELEEEDTDLRKLQDWLEKIGKLDFYAAPLAKEAAARLRAY